MLESSLPNIQISLMSASVGLSVSRGIAIYQPWDYGSWLQSDGSNAPYLELVAAGCSQTEQ